MSFDKYPLAKKFMDQHPNMTVDQAIDYFLKKWEAEGDV